MQTECLRGVEFNVVKVFALLAAIQDSAVSGIYQQAVIATRNLLYWTVKRLVGQNEHLDPHFSNKLSPAIPPDPFLTWF